MFFTEICSLFVLVAVYLVFFFCLLSFCPLCEKDINAMEMEDDKRDLISREISKFRDTHKVMSFTAVVTLLDFGEKTPHCVT